MMFRFPSTVAMVLNVRSDSQELRLKGQVLAIILLGLLGVTLVLTLTNLLLDQNQYTLTNILSIGLLLILYAINRIGLVWVSSIGVVIACVSAALTLFSEDMAAGYTALALPILLASSLLYSWAGFIVVGVLLVGIVIFDQLSLSVLILLIVSVISYLLSESLRRSNRQSMHQSLHDPLTGLPNRKLLEQRLRASLARAAQERNFVAVVFLDLDNFKLVNDSLGHALGDELLVEIGRRLQRTVGPEHLTARLGGDEFVIVLDDLRDSSTATRAIERIQQELRNPVRIGGSEISVEASLGVTYSKPLSSEVSNLLSEADTAMYQAKEQRLKYAFFDQQMYTRAMGRLQAETQLRQAVEQRQFDLNYQPTIDLASGEITGLEALVRWRTPDEQLVMPSEFIPLAEETNLIVPIGEQVLEDACKQFVGWKEQYPSLVLSVNISPRQFMEPRLIESIMENLQASGLQAANLELEVTETVMMKDQSRAIATLNEIRRLGARVAIDDFGTGYSSLSYITDLPASSLKIDRSFIQRLGDRDKDSATVRLIIELAHAMGMEVIAEGVQSEAQARILRQLNCDTAQGFYFYRPLDSESTDRLLRERRGHTRTDNL